MRAHGRRLWLSLGAGAAVAALLLAMLALGARKPPDIPGDVDHATSRNTGRCLECHGPGMEAARGPRHLQRDDCFNCHAWTEPASR